MIQKMEIARKIRGLKGEAPGGNMNTGLHNRPNHTDCHYSYVVKGISIFRRLVRQIFLMILTMAAFYDFSYAIDNAGPSIEELFEMPIEDILHVKIVSTGFFETEKCIAPGYSIVLDMKEIEEGPSRNLQDIVNMYVPGQVSGVHIQHGALHGVRGVLIDNNAKTLVMLDEQNLNQRTHFGYTAGMLSPLMGDIDSIEFINGPTSIVRGSGAINGSINMIPKNGKDNKGFFSSSEWGFKENFYKTEMGYGFTYGSGKDVYVYLGLYDAEGFTPKMSFNGPPLDDGVNSFGFGRLNYKGSVYWHHDGFSMNTFFYDNNPNRGSYDISQYFNNTTLGLKPKYTFSIDDTNWLDVEWSLLATDFYDSRNDIKAGGSELHNELKSIYKTKYYQDHDLALGALIGFREFNEKDRFFSEDLDRGHEILDTHWEEIGIFAEDVWRLNPKLIMTLGLRFDKYYTHELSGWMLPKSITPEETDGHFSPRAAAAFELDSSSVIKLSYQHGFRVLDVAYYHFNEFFNYYADKIGYDKSPPLKPETTDGFELNYSKRWGEKTTTEFNLFYNIHKDQLAWGSLSPYWSKEEIENIQSASRQSWSGMFQNQQDTGYAKGGEFVVSFKANDHFSINSSYSYVTVDGIPQKFPAHLIKVNLIGHFFRNRLHTDINYIFNNSMENLTVSADEPWDPDYKQNKNLFNVSVSYDILNNLNLYMKINNALEDDFPPHGIGPNIPYAAYMGSDERRVYCGIRISY